MKRNGQNNSYFIKIHNPLLDKDFKYFPTLHLIIFIFEGDLFLKLILDHKTIYKESVVKSLNHHFSNPDDYLGIVTVLTAFLSELRSSKYQICQGAFDERSYNGDFSEIDIRSVLVQKEDSRIVYRSRQCTILVKNSIQCDQFTSNYHSVFHSIRT